MGLLFFIRLVGSPEASGLSSAPKELHIYMGLLFFLRPLGSPEASGLSS